MNDKYQSNKESNMLYQFFCGLVSGHESIRNRKKLKCGGPDQRVVNSLEKFFYSKEFQYYK